MNHHSVKRVSNSRILKVALNLFSSKGYSETKMSEIAKDSGLSVGALYLRFRSKEELCLELIRDQMRDFERLTKGLLDDDPLNALREYIKINIGYAFKRRQLLSVLIRERHLPFIQPVKRDFFRTQQRIIKDILISGIRGGVFKKVDNIEETASLIFACIRGVILLRLVFQAGKTRSLSDSLFKLITDGIREGLP